MWWNNVTEEVPEVRDEFIDRVVKAMRLHAYEVYDEPGEVNIVYIEGMDMDGTPNDNRNNVFNDLRITFEFEDGVPIITGIWDATTEPSLRWTQRPMNPKGAARIQFGQYQAWQVGIHLNNHEALVQTGGPVTVCRDLNQDFQRIGDKLDTGFFGINQHWGYDLPREDMGSSSAGCIVGRTKNGHKEFMALVKKDPRYLSNRNFIYTTTILPANEIN